jgi:uncharacterized membrane protein YciS (DUF1049 family)
MSSQARQQQQQTPQTNRFTAAPLPWQYTLRVAAVAFVLGFALEAVMSYTTYFDQLRVAEGKRRIAKQQQQHDESSSSK